MNRTTIERTSTNEDETRSVLRRRSLIAGVGVLAAGLLATKSAETVRASDGPLQLGGPNTPTAQTQLSASLDAQNPLLHLSAGGAGNGIESYGDGTGIGVLGYGVSNDGVKGGTNTADGTHAGVHGTAAPGGNGVLGECDFSATSYGVYGKTDIGVAVRGQASASGTGIFGTSYSSNGVSGQSTSGVGVYGSSTSGVGAVGLSSGNYGVLGMSTQIGFAGLTGITTTPSVPAFAGGSSVPTALAAQFNGGVYIDCTTVGGGQFVVNPMSAKSGLLKHPDGSHRLMYSVEAPESWAEDFGTAQLVGGKAEVKFDPDFVPMIHTDEYHVFLTPHGDTNGLHIANHGPTGFTVQEHKGGTASLTFSWRVVAKPKVDNHTATRLAKYEIPAPLHLPTKDELPKRTAVTEKR